MNDPRDAVNLHYEQEQSKTATQQRVETTHARPPRREATKQFALRSNEYHKAEIRQPLTAVNEPDQPHARSPASDPFSESVSSEEAIETAKLLALKEGLLTRDLQSWTRELALPHLSKAALHAPKLNGSGRDSDYEKLWKPPSNRGFLPCAKPTPNYTSSPGFGC